MCHNGAFAALVFCRTSHHCQMLQELQLWKISHCLLLLTRALYPFLFLAVPSCGSNATAVHLLTPEVPGGFLLQMFSVCSSHCCMRGWGECPGPFSQKLPREWTQAFKSLPCISRLSCTQWRGWKCRRCQCEERYCWAWVMEWVCWACGRHIQSRWKHCRGWRALLVMLTGGHWAAKAPCSLEGAAEASKPFYMHLGGS